MPAMLRIALQAGVTAVGAFKAPFLARDLIAMALPEAPRPTPMSARLPVCSVTFQTQVRFGPTFTLDTGRQFLLR